MHHFGQCIRTNLVHRFPCRIQSVCLLYSMFFVPIRIKLTQFVVSVVVLFPTIVLENNLIPIKLVNLLWSRWKKQEQCFVESGKYMIPSRTTKKATSLRRRVDLCFVVKAKSTVGTLLWQQVENTCWE